MTIKKKAGLLSPNLSIYIPKSVDSASCHEYNIGACHGNQSMRDYILVGNMQKCFPRNILIGGGNYIFKATNENSGYTQLNEVH